MWTHIELLLILVSLVHCCHPECRYQCDDPVCLAICHPVCGPTICERCLNTTEGLVCLPTTRCHVRCPTDMCESDSCPQCETICPDLCVGVPGCSILCQAVECAWQCEKPTQCPLPRCELQCEAPACQLLNGASHAAVTLAILLPFLLLVN